MKNLVLPTSLSGKLEFYVSLGLLKKETLENKEFLAQLEKCVDQEVAKLLIKLGKEQPKDRDEKSEVKSTKKPPPDRAKAENIVFDSASLDNLESKLKKQVLHETLQELRDKFEAAENTDVENKEAENKEAEKNEKTINRALIQDPRKSFAGLIVSLQKLVDATQGYFEDFYEQAEDITPANIAPNYKDVRQLGRSLDELRENFNNLEAIEDFEPEELTFSIGGSGESLRLSINPYVVETELGKYEKPIGWMSPYLIVQLNFGEDERLKSSHIDEHYEAFMSHFEGVQCVCLSYSKRSIQSKFVDSDVIHTISNWLNDAGIDVLLHEAQSGHANKEIFNSLTATVEDKTMMKYMGILRSFGVITSKLNLLFELETDSLSLQNKLLAHDMEKVPMSLEKEVASVLVYFERVMQREMDLIVNSYQSELSNRNMTVQSQMEREIKKAYAFENRELVHDEQPIDKWDATYTLKKTEIQELANSSVSKLEGVLKSISSKLQNAWDTPASEQNTRKEHSSDIKHKFLLPSLQTKNLSQCLADRENESEFLNEFLEQAILHKEVIVPPVSEEGIKSLAESTGCQFANETSSKAFTRFTVPKIVDNWFRGAKPLSLALRVLKLTASMPMRILGPVFAFGALFMLFGLAGPKQLFQKTVGGEIPSEACAGFIGNEDQYTKCLASADSALFSPSTLLISFLLLSIVLAMYSLYRDSNQRRDTELKKSADAAIAEHRRIVEQVEKKFMDQLLKGTKVSVSDFSRRLKVHLDIRTNEIDAFNANVRKSLEEKQNQVNLRKARIEAFSKEVELFNKLLAKGQSQFGKYIKEALHN